MRRILLPLVALIWSSGASAQQPNTVLQSGTVTPGHPTSWVASGIVQDAGTALNGKLSGVGVTTGNAQAFCTNTGPTTGPYSQLCWGASNILGLASINLSANNGAAPLSFIINVNGTPVFVCNPAGICSGGGGTGGGTVSSVGLASPFGTLNIGGTNPITAAGTINVDVDPDAVIAWLGLQSSQPQPLAPSGAVYTAAALASNDWSLTLSSACPCTLANPSGGPMPDGAHGVIYVAQDGTGGRLIGTYGSQFVGGSNVLLASAPGAITPIAYTTLGGSIILQSNSVTTDFCRSYDSVTTVAAATNETTAPWAQGLILKIVGATNGTGTPSFTAAGQIGGTNITGCSSLNVNSGSEVSASCSAANTFTGPAQLELVTSSISGTPNQAYACLIIQHSSN